MKLRVLIEASFDGVKDFFYCASEFDPTCCRATPTEFVNSRPTPVDNTLVRQCDSFYISFVGMSVIPEDTIFCDKNELLLYSLNNNPEAIRNSTSCFMDYIVVVAQSYLSYTLRTTSSRYQAPLPNGHCCCQ